MSDIGKSLQTTELVRKIQIFCETLCGRKFFSYQAQFSRRIIRAVLENDSDTITALMARQSGKSFTVSATLSGLMVILPIMANMPLFIDDPRFTMFKSGMMIGVFAPTQKQSQIIFNNIKEFLSSQRALKILQSEEFNIEQGTFNGDKVTLIFMNYDNTKSTISCYSASEGSNIEGGSYHLYICDEAQDISNYKYRRSIFPTVSFYNGTKILIGTPTIRRNFFYDTIKLNEKEWQSGDKRYKNHYEYDCDTIVKYNPRYAKTLESARKEMGEGSDEFQSNYKLKWIFSFGMFIDSEKFTSEPIAMQDLHREVTSSTPCIVGIDVGKSQDSTVVTVGIPDYTKPIIIEKSKDADAEDYILYDIKIIDWLEIVGDNYEQQFYMVKDYLSHFNVKLCVIDGTGVGSPVADRLAASVNFPVRPFVFTQSSKSMLMKFFNAHLNNGCFHYPASPEVMETIEFKKFQQQCLELTKDYNGDKLIVAAPKERNKHDDYPFSAALMVWGLKYEPIDVEVVNENAFIQTNNIFVQNKRHRRKLRW